MPWLMRDSELANEGKKGRGTMGFRQIKSGLLTTVCAVALLGLAGCDEAVEDTAEEAVEPAAEATEEAAGDLMDAAEEAATDMMEAAEEAVEEAVDEAEEGE